MKTFELIVVLKSIFIVTLIRYVKPSYDEKKYFPMLMPNVQPVEENDYLCTAFQTPKTDVEYIVEFTPNASMHTAHHVIIYGCDIPGKWEEDSPSLVWECGAMNEKKSGDNSAPVCSSGAQVIYAWASDAPALQLPDGVAFKVGKGTGINFLVLQVHYANVEKFRNGEKDNSGVILTILPSDTNEISKAAGIYLIGTFGMIKAGEEEHFEAACQLDEQKVIHPFAFRTHTHALGTVVSGYKIDKKGKWHLIGKHSPQEPQMFYPVKDKNLVIEYGDIMAGRCTMYNFRNHDTYTGTTINDEMCSFYMMYYTDGDTPLKSKYCATPGPRLYYWNTDSNIDFVPEDINLSASSLDV